MKERSSRRFGIGRLLIGVAALALLFAVPASNAATVWSTYYEDNFDGSALDSSKWNTSIATAGARWCPDTATSSTGTWLNPSIEPCQGVTQASPYGAVAVSGGLAGFSEGVARAFPYVFRGPPSASPFPSAGNFILEIRMKYDAIGGNGDGILATSLADTTPSGSTPPWGYRALQVWADHDGGLTAGTGPTSAPVTNPTDWHVYRLEYISGSYSLYVDNVLSVGPLASEERPNTMWIGNLGFTHWGAFDWSDFTLDYVRVTSPQLYAFSGFQQPVDNAPTMNSVKAGAAVPVRFSLGGYQGLDIFAPGSPWSARSTCDFTGDDVIEEVSAAGQSSLKYDAATDTYTYVWKTDKAWAGTCRVLRVRLDDGTTHFADFKLK